MARAVGTKGSAAAVASSTGHAIPPGASAAAVSPRDAARADDRGPLHAEHIEQGGDTRGVPRDGHRVGAGWVAAAVAEQIEHQHPMSFRQPRQHVLPQMRRREGAVNEDERRTAAAFPERVAVAAYAPQVDELAAHQR